MTENISDSQAGAAAEGNAVGTASGGGITTPSTNQEAGGAVTPGEPSAVSPVSDPSPQFGSVEHYEKRVRDLQSQNDKLRHQLSRHEELQEEQSRALLVLKDALLRANPLVPAELLDTSSLDNLRASFQSAEQVVGRVRERLEEEQRSAGHPWRIPAGAPVRAGVDVQSLSPGEKIRHGLAQKMGR